MFYIPVSPDACPRPIKVSVDGKGGSVSQGLIAVKLKTGRFRQGLSLEVVGKGSYDSIQESERRLILMYLQMADGKIRRKGNA